MSIILKEIDFNNQNYKKNMTMFTNIWVWFIYAFLYTVLYIILSIKKYHSINSLFVLLIINMYLDLEI